MRKDSVSPNSKKTPVYKHVRLFDLLANKSTHRHCPAGQSINQSLNHPDWLAEERRGD